MRYTYDGHVDALYIYVHEGAPAEQVEVGDVTADLDDEGRLVGIEVLTTRLGWSPSDVIERFGLDEQVAQDLRFLSTIPWVEHVQVSTAAPAARSGGSGVLVKVG